MIATGVTFRLPGVNARGLTLPARACKRMRVFDGLSEHFIGHLIDLGKERVNDFQ